MDNQTVSLTASNIRYLLAVKQLTDQGARVRCVDVAKHLEVARPSALRALEYLGTLGIFEKPPQGIWSLTQSGQELAQRYRTVQAVAKEVGVTEFHAEVLPEDKAAFVRKEHEAGRKVIMIGDGVNDSPALSEADAGVSISTGAAIAREVADITISAEDLRCLITMRKISDALMARIHGNYWFIISFNMMLIILGVAGILPPTTSALLHNMSTLGISLKSMTNLLE